MMCDLMSGTSAGPLQNARSPQHSKSCTGSLSDKWGFLLAVHNINTCQVARHMCFVCTGTLWEFEKIYRDCWGRRPDDHMARSMDAFRSELASKHEAVNLALGATARSGPLKGTQNAFSQFSKYRHQQENDMVLPSVSRKKALFFDRGLKARIGQDAVPEQSNFMFSFSPGTKPRNTPPTVVFV
jgi:hypothetical protein